MSDVTTKLIHDTFIQNRPANVGVQEAEALFTKWLFDHNFQPEAQPFAPEGFDYETVTPEPASVPSDEDLAVIALAADNVDNTASMLADLMDSMPSTVQRKIAHTLGDLDCAAKHLNDMLDGYGYQPTVEE